MGIENEKKKVVFVGSFMKTTRDGGTGGQLYACRTLIESEISNRIEWLTIDSTAKSFPPPTLSLRALNATKRIGQLIQKGRGHDVDTLMIMTSAKYSFIEKGVMALIGKALGKRVVMCPRSGLLLDDYERSLFMRIYIPFVLNHCDTIVCQGETWRQLFKRQFSVKENRLSVIPNWIDSGPYSKIVKDRDSSPRIPNHTCFLYMGLLAEYKGIMDLIDAIYNSRDKLSDTKTIVCGEGPLLDSAKNKVVELNIESLFDFRGWVHGNEKTEVFLESDVLVLPSHREGMPNIVLEAMAAGLAVIATKVGGVPDIIEHDESGIIVPAKDTVRFGEVMVELHHDTLKRARIAKKGIQHIRKSHDIGVIWPKVAHALSHENMDAL